MKSLLYCVMWSKESQNLFQGKGVQGQDLILVEQNNMTAVVSDFDPTERSLDIESLITYHDVIDRCFQFGTVIPFRFKTVLASDIEVRRLLDLRGMEYESILGRLSHKAEMGVRVIVDEIICQSHNPVDAIPVDEESGAPGKSYLAKRRHAYSQENALNSKCEEIVEALKMAMKGKYQDLKVESTKKAVLSSGNTQVLVSAYFLVEKGFVDLFKLSLDEVKPTLGGRVLLSGPWAPYNFVL